MRRWAAAADVPPYPVDAPTSARAELQKVVKGRQELTARYSETETVLEVRVNEACGLDLGHFLLLGLVVFWRTRCRRSKSICTLVVSTSQQELKRLDDDANVFKAVGPVLVKQDLMEAKSNVSNRLDYIKKDIDRLETQIKGMENKMFDREREVRGGAPGWGSSERLLGVWASPGKRGTEREHTSRL